MYVSDALYSLTSAVDVPVTENVTFVEPDADVSVKVRFEIVSSLLVKKHASASGGAGHVLPYTIAILPPDRRNVVGLREGVELVSVRVVAFGIETDVAFLSSYDSRSDTSRKFWDTMRWVFDFTLLYIMSHANVIAPPINIEMSAIYKISSTSVVPF